MTTIAKVDNGAKKKKNVAPVEAPEEAPGGDSNAVAVEGQMVLHGGDFEWRFCCCCCLKASSRAIAVAIIRSNELYWLRVGEGDGLLGAVTCRRTLLISYDSPLINSCKLKEKE